MKWSEEDLLKIQNLGKKSVAEIKSKLNSYLKRREEEQNKTEPINSFVDQLLSIFPLRDREVVEGRFGLWDGIKKTLEEIGERFGLTREGIRQIERKAIKTLLYSVTKGKVEDYIKTLANETVIPFIKETGGVATEDELVNLLSIEPKQKVRTKMAISFLSNIYFKNTFPFLPYLVEIEKDIYGLDSPTKILYEQIIRLARSRLEKEGKPLRLDELTVYVLKCLECNDKTAEKFINRSLLTTKDLTRFGDDNEIGLLEWSELTKKKMAEMALSEMGEPAHYTQIALWMEKLFPDRVPFNPCNVHATLQSHKDDVFVWRSPGVYGLKSWGLEKPPYVKEYLIELLHQSDKPLHIDQLKEEVLKVSNCKEASVFMTLDLNEEIFVKYPEGFYGLCEWEV